MQVIPSPDDVRRAVRKARRDGAVTAVVPTMGALHAGHVSLIQQARSECDLVVATIFVNPTQFGPNEDFERYPRTLEQDLEKCSAAGADIVFTPETARMYGVHAQSVVSVKELTQKLEGRVRPTHFDGVTTIVAKLFHITEPDKAYFGQKDYQQQLIIRRMVCDLDFGLEVVTCDIVREADGLALSSRNRYLSDAERQQALVLYHSLQLAENLAATAVPDEIARQMCDRICGTPGVELDYAVVVDPETLEPSTADSQEGVALVAARLGNTRLIDNCRLRFR
jgi:pantoate--beta-alanine ligase